MEQKVLLFLEILIFSVIGVFVVYPNLFDS